MSDPTPLDPQVDDPRPDTADNAAAEDAAARQRKILIGSQRDPAAYRPRRRDWLPIETGEKPEPKPEQPPAAPAKEEQPAAPVAQAPAAPIQAPPLVVEAIVPDLSLDEPEDVPDVPAGAAPARPQRFNLATEAAPVARGPSRVPPPSVRDRLSADMEDEFDLALAGASLDELMTGAKTPGNEAMLEPETRCKGRVVVVRREEVFVELGGREQGVLPLHQFAEPPQVGDEVEVVVQKFNAEEGLYDLGVPGSAARVEDWGDLNSGMVVEARVTGHNTGGLECEVNHIRGFIPISQIALYRVEGIEQFVGQAWPCLITEANPERRNLVLSRRAILEREKEESRKNTLNSLKVGELRDGTVRKLMDFGAFVQLADGVDGLLHISQLAWYRVKHPSEILTEGQKIQVRIEKIDPQTGKIGLAYRELQQSPWARAAEKFPANSVVRGTVTKTMEFGAFVALEPGVEGLVHISELSHKRLWRTTDAVKEGDEVEVLVLSIDADAQRISLSMKALTAAPKTKEEKEKEQEQAAEAAAASAPPPKPQPTGPQKPLKGGLGRGSGGAQFGLKW